MRPQHQAETARVDELIGQLVDNADLYAICRVALAMRHGLPFRVELTLSTGFANGAVFVRGGATGDTLIGAPRSPRHETFVECDRTHGSKARP